MLHWIRCKYFRKVQKNFLTNLNMKFGNENLYIQHIIVCHSHQVFHNTTIPDTYNLQNKQILDLMPIAIGKKTAISRSSNQNYHPSTSH